MIDHTILRPAGPRPAELRPAGLRPAGLRSAGLRPAGRAFAFVLLFCLGYALAGCSPATNVAVLEGSIPGPVGGEPTTRYEYLCLEATGNPEVTVRALNLAGERGWELVTGGEMYCFKRARPSAAE